LACLLPLLLLLALATAPIASAEAHGPNFSLKAIGAPGGLPYFVYHSRRGGTVGGVVRVTNDGDRGGTVRLYPADAVTGQTTGAVYRSRRSPRHDVGAWLSLPIRRLKLGPHQSRTVRFTAAVPTGAGPGQHLGGIVAETAALKKASAKRTSRGAFQVDLRKLSILAVQMDLPGKAVEKLTLTKVRPGPAEGFQTLLIGMRNEGDRLLRGSASIVVDSESGERLKRKKFTLDTFVPHTAIAYPFPVPGTALGAGRYRAVVDVRYGHGHRAHLVSWFTVTEEGLEQVFGSESHPPAAGGGGGGGGGSGPWLLIAAAVAAALLAPLAIWVFRRRRPPTAPTPAVTYLTAIHFEGGRSHRHVDRLRWLDPATLSTGESTRAGMVEWIRGGGRLRVRRDDDVELTVYVVDGRVSLLRTGSGGTWTDDLLNLPTY